MDTYYKILKPVIVIVAVIAAALFVITINITEKSNSNADSIASDLTYFTNFELHGLDGAIFTNDDLKKAKVTVINGWAPWCGPCTGEMPALNILNDEYRNKGLQVVGVVADYYPNHPDGESDGYNQEIRDVISATGCRYVNLVSDEAFYNGPYKTMKNSFPCTWAVDEDGHLIEIVHGRKSEEDWRALFDKWLKGR